MITSTNTYKHTMKNYTVAFCDYNGTIHKGNGILAKTPSLAIRACLDWIFEYRDDARECSIAYVMETDTGKVKWGFDPVSGVKSVDKNPIMPLHLR